MTGNCGPATPLLPSSTPLPPSGKQCTRFVLCSQDVLLAGLVLAGFEANPATRKGKTGQ
jgi:hypothetical protein